MPRNSMGNPDIVTDVAQLQERIAKLAGARDTRRADQQQSNRERAPDFAEFVDHVR